MFAHFRRHQKTLWIFISAGVIISFVWYFNPNQRYARRGYGGGGGGEDTVGTMFGEPIRRAQYVDAYHEAILHHLFTYGEWPQDNEASRQLRPVEHETRNRLLLDRKLKDYNIEVSDQATADWIAQAFQDRETKTYRQEVYQRFVQQLQQRRLKEVDFLRYAKHQVAITHLAAIAGATGRLVTPQQAEQAYREEHEKVDTKLVTFPLSNYVAKVQTTPELLATYYTNNIARYRLPERVQLSFVAFPATNYMARAEQVLDANSNLTQQIDAEYMRRGPSFYNDMAGNQLSPEAAKQRIRQEVLKESEMNEARRDAFNFATELDQVPAKTNTNTNALNTAEPLETLAAAKGLIPQISEPFSQFSGPRDMKVPEQFAKIAFRLTPEEPIVQEPVPGEEAFYVVALKHRIPTEVPALDTIRSQVTQDYQRSEAMNMARAAGASFLNALTNALASGQTIDAAAQQNGVSVADIAPFAKDARDIPGLPATVSVSTLRGRAFDLSAGHASSYQPTSDGGFIVYVEKFIPASDEEVKSDLGQFREELERRMASEAFNDWFRKQVQLAQLHLPGDKLDQEQMEQ
jgi:hypothetical protein